MLNKKPKPKIKVLKLKSGMSNVPPLSVQQAARQGLELRKKFGRGGLSTREAGRLGIGSGVARANSLARGQKQSVATLKKMRGFLSRQAKNANTPPEKGNGQISLKLWGKVLGNNTTENWVDKELKRLGN